MISLQFSSNEIEIVVKQYMSVSHYNEHKHSSSNVSSNIVTHSHIYPTHPHYQRKMINTVQGCN